MRNFVMLCLVLLWSAVSFAQGAKQQPTVDRYISSPDKPKAKPEKVGPKSKVRGDSFAAPKVLGDAKNLPPVDPNKPVPAGTYNADDDAEPTENERIED